MNAFLKYIICVGLIAQLFDFSAEGQVSNTVSPDGRDISDSSIQAEADEQIQGDIRTAAIEMIKLNDRSKIFSVVVPLGKYDRVKLLQQILMFVRSGARGEEEGYGALALFGELQFSHDEKISAVIPWVGTSDSQLSRTIEEILWEMEHVNELSDGVPNYKHYESWLINHTNSAPDTLINYMYFSNPRAAVSSMARVYGDNVVEADIANILSGESMAALHTLAERPEWWAHLYVASILEKDSLLRTPELMDILEKDTHPIVQEKVSRLGEEVGPKP